MSTPGPPEPAVKRLAARLLHSRKLRKVEKRAVGGENLAIRARHD